jgi:hypothetical protein
MMSIPHPELVALDNYQVTVKPYPGGDMATRVLFSPWRFPDEDVRLTPKGPRADPLVQVEHGHFVTHNPNGIGQLVLFGDSFATQLVPFLAQHFEDVHRYVGEAMNGAIIARHHPDAVILETVERQADRLLLPQIDLPRACEK